MKIKETIPIKHIVSEPGDGTRYDYLCFRQHDVFYFFTYYNSFSYPQHIHKSETDEMEIAKRWDCNPWTVKECLRTIKELS